MLTLPHVLHRAAVQVPRSHQGLQVFGIKLEVPTELSYSTLDEALQRHELEVTEMTEGGSVPTLKLINKSDSRVFLMAGEQLIGAKQNRVLNTSLLVESHSEVPIPVSCVEQGRWHYLGRSFGSAGTTSHSTLRHKMTKSVSRSYDASATPTSDQHEVWQEVSRKMDSMGSTSDSMALEQTYMDTRPKLDEMLTHLPVPEGCYGAVFALNGKIVGMDLFDQPTTLIKLWPKLVRGYAIDALENPSAASCTLQVHDVEEWLARAEHVHPKAFPSPGLGEDVRLEGVDVVGASLIVESHPVHVQLFAESRA